MDPEKDGADVDIEMKSTNLLSKPLSSVHISGDVDRNPTYGLTETKLKKAVYRLPDEDLDEIQQLSSLGKPTNPILLTDNQTMASGESFSSTDSLEIETACRKISMPNPAAPPRSLSVNIASIDVDQRAPSTVDGLELFNDVDSLSPQTPSSQFKKCRLENEGDVPTPLLAAVLCHWDNIVGPKVRYLWLTGRRAPPALLTIDLLNFLAHYTVSGEIARDPTDPNVETKLYTSADKGVALVSLVFGAVGYSQCLTVHSLSLIASHHELACFLKYKDVCLEWLQRVVPRLRVLLAKVSD